MSCTSINRLLTSGFRLLPWGQHAGGLFVAATVSCQTALGCGGLFPSKAGLPHYLFLLTKDWRDGAVCSGFTPSLVVTAWKVNCLSFFSSHPVKNVDPCSKLCALFSKLQ